MAEMKLLNLDDLAKDQKFVVLDGEKHEVVGDTIETFVERAKRAKNRPQTNELSEQFVYLVEIVHDAIPSIPSDRLMKLTLAQLDAIVAYTLVVPKDVSDAVDRQNAKGGESANTGKSESAETPEKSQPSISASPSSDALASTESNQPG